MTVDWLNKLGLRESDDQDGIIRAACDLFQGHNRSLSLRMEDSYAFAVAQMLIRECRDCEPALVAATLLRPVMMAQSDPAALDKHISPRMAEILEGLSRNDYKSAAEFKAALLRSDPAVKKAMVAMNTYDLEKFMILHKDKPLDATVVFWGEQNRLSVFLTVLFVNNQVFRQCMIGATGEDKLDKRFLSALQAVEQKLLVPPGLTLSSQGLHKKGSAPN